MSTPVATQILDEIGLRLANITVANGYFHTLLKINRASLIPFKNGDMPAINYYPTEDTLIDNISRTVERRILSVVIEFYTMTRDRPFSDVASELSADALIALNRSDANPQVADNPSVALGGLVTQLKINRITPVIGEGQKPYCGAVLSVDVSYGVDRQDPFTLIT